MKPINGFSLQESPHLVAQGKSELVLNGKHTGFTVDGIALKGQFEVRSGYLLITDYDDPWDSIGVVTLLDKKLKVISKRKLGQDGIYFAKHSFVPHHIEVAGDDLIVSGLDPSEGSYCVSLRNPTLFKPNQIELRRIKTDLNA